MLHSGTVCLTGPLGFREQRWISLSREKDVNENLTAT